MKYVVEFSQKCLLCGGRYKWHKWGTYSTPAQAASGVRQLERARWVIRYKEYRIREEADVPQ